MYFIIEYTQIYIFLIISTAVSCLLLAVAYLASNNPKLNLDKKAAYECGFEPFEDARTKFNIHFYLVGMLFLIFDLEIALIYPWAVNYKISSYQGLIAISYFIFILTVGFIYEWNKGALDWSSSKTPQVN